jgi:hypothetical protein
MPLPDVNQLIDLERYPIDQPGQPGYEKLLREGRRALEQQALFSMTRFVRPQAIEPMAYQLQAQLANSCRYDREPGMVFGQSYIDELQASIAESTR